MVSLVVYVLIFTFIVAKSGIPNNEYGYIEIQKDSFLFFWFYGSTNTNYNRNELPIILWLSGGPGEGSSGYGNFAEFGPYDQWLHKRNNSWINFVNILFIDCPFGAGYSYTNNQSVYTTSIEQISNNLLFMHQQFLSLNVFDSSWFTKLPYYVFGEGYGGKMAYHFAYTLLKAIENNQIKMNLQGVLSCDGWIDPQSYVNNYGIFALSQGLINYHQKSILDEIALKSQLAINNDDYRLSHTYFDQLLNNLSIFTNKVNIYDCIQFDLYDVESPINDTQLSLIMNGEIKQNLTIIPRDVKWDGNGSDICFQNLYDDYMKSVLYAVEYLLEKNISCNVWNAKYDLMVNNLGTLEWINKKLNWTYLSQWKLAPRTCILTMDNKSVNYYQQKYSNFAFYSVLENTGHNLPAYDLDVATEIMCDIVNISC